MVATATRFTACGSESPEHGCAEYAEAYCARERWCDPARSSPDDIRVDCVPARVALCERTLGLPGSGLTDAALSACAKEIAAGECSGVPCEGEGSGIHGSRPNGYGCRSPFQCASGRCKIPSTATCGGCAPQAVPGETCRIGGCASTPTLYCENLGGDGKCAPRIAPGEPCTASLPPWDDPCMAPGRCEGGRCILPIPVGGACQSTDWCGGWNTTCVNGACTALPGEGDPCSSSTPPCILGLHCGSNGKCVTSPEVELVGVGEACDQSAVGCRPGTKCKSGVCVSKVPYGGACDPTGAGGSCESGIVCVEGKCQIPPLDDCL